MLEIIVSSIVGQFTVARSSQASKYYRRCSKMDVLGNNRNQTSRVVTVLAWLYEPHLSNTGIGVGGFPQVPIGKYQQHACGPLMELRKGAWPCH